MYFLLLFLCAFISVNAQKSKASVGSSLEKKLDSIFSSFSQSTPGIAVTVLKNGKVIAKKAYGLASLEFKVPFTHSTIVRMAYSEGREFIAIAAVLMEKEGIINLNDKVRKYFPELPEWSEPVTIKDLLNHQSGFIDEWDALLLTQASMNNRVDKSQFLQLLFNQPRPEVEPTKGYMYSNSDYGLLRLIMEKASGADLADYAKRKLFTPLGMMSTGFHNDKEEVIAGRALNYIHRGGERYRVDMHNKESPGGNYHIVTTANDLEKWAAAHNSPESDITKAKNRLLEKAILMPGGTKDYTFGYKILEDGKNSTIAHQGVNQFTYLSRVKDLSIITVGNSYSYNIEYHNQIRNYLLKTAAKPFINKQFIRTSVTYTHKELKAFTGTYIDEDTVTFESFTKARKNIVHFVIINDSLKWQYSKTEIIPLVPIAKNVFKDPDYEVYIEFIPSSNGSMKINTHSHTINKVFNLIKDDVVLWQPTKETLATFTGKYYSKHLDFYWTIVQDEQGKLVIKRPTIADKYLDPVSENEFLLIFENYAWAPQESWVRFHKDAQGKVTHLTVSHPRLMHHRFDKTK
jgi:CubicO group peptidase (beta-lactamase class C family)